MRNKGYKNEGILITLNDWGKIKTFFYKKKKIVFLVFIHQKHNIQNVTFFHFKKTNIYITQHNNSHFIPDV